MANATGRCPAWVRRAGVAALGLALAACGGGSDGGSGPVGPPGDPVTPPGEFDPLPGVQLEIVGLQGASGTQGQVLPGDVLTFLFRVRTDAGEDMDLATFSAGATYVSGPTFNYQRVIASQGDVVASAVFQGDGVWSYTFPVPVPAAYLPPYNDTPSFGVEDGELAGLPLLDGTYSVGLQLYRTYDVEGVSLRDAGSDVYDFRLGTPGALEPRAVVAEANCAACHTEVRAHGGTRVHVDLCLLCHTAGSEDKNVPAVAGGTPGVTVDFKVMIHKIHAGKHLPSVRGVATNPNGSRNYAATPVPLQYVGFMNAVVDFSDVGFPVWPSLNLPSTRDSGYDALSAPNKATDDVLRSSPIDCAKCHGDPDGDGPAGSPAQGELAWSQPSRNACGSCHDDIDWAEVYSANGSAMPPNLGNETCSSCHPVAGNSLAVQDGHVHPLLDPSINPGLNFNVSALADVGGNGNGKLDPGEKVQVTFTMTDDAGADVAPATLQSITTLISGPTSNYNLVLNGTLNKNLLTTSPYTVLLAQGVTLERLGVATAGADAFTASRSPIYTVTGSTASVLQRAPGAPTLPTTLAAAAAKWQNFLDVVSTAGWARNDYVVVEDGVVGKEEYAQVTLVEGTRLWVSVPLRTLHAAGAAVGKVAVAAAAAGTFTVNGPAAQVVEAGAGFTTGATVLATYTSDFLMPAEYPPPLNDSPVLGENVGDWVGRPILSGTYTLDVYGAIDRWIFVPGSPPVPGKLPGTPTFDPAAYTDDPYSMRGASGAGQWDFLVGAATTVEPYDLISAAQNCYACHNDLYFHGGGRRSFVTCVVCHGAAGAEDRPRYVAGNAPATTGVSIGFREMLHRIHKGEELAKAATYTVVGFGAAPYPNNYTAYTYDEVVFPAWPGGVEQCVRCHGNDAWQQPTNRTYPGAVQQAEVWGFVCGSCHDSDSAHAHIDTNTDPQGYESCNLCHGPGQALDVAKVHVPR